MKKYTLGVALALILSALFAWSTPACALSLFGFGGDGAAYIGEKLMCRRVRVRMQDYLISGRVTGEQTHILPQKQRRAGGHIAGAYGARVCRRKDYAQRGILALTQRAGEDVSYSGRRGNAAKRSERRIERARRSPGTGAGADDPIKRRVRDK